MIELVFWLAVFSVVYPYGIYPAILYVWVRVRPRPAARTDALSGDHLPTVSIILVARNEESRIAERLAGLVRVIEGPGLNGEIVIVSDGSTDQTAARARSFDSGGVPVRIVELSPNIGKAAALTEGCAVANSTILAFADARQTWADDALVRLLENFEDPTVGAVSGELFVKDSGGAMAVVGLYWRFEKWLRRSESLVGSTAGLTGAICAVRRELFRPIPPGTVLDDVYWPLKVVMLGRRVIFDPRAHAFDRLPDDLRDELRRKVRTLGGNYQLVGRLPASLAPWRNPVWFVFVSHKLMRLAVPWAALVVLGLGPFLKGLLPSLLSFAGLIVILCGLFGLNETLAKRSRLLGAFGSFLALNYAAWLGFWVWASGRTSRSWTRVAYRAEPAEPPASEKFEQVLP